MTKEKEGKEFYQLTTLAKKLKAEQNRNKIELGMVLWALKKFFEICELEGREEFGTFNQFLAEIHLNNRRVFKMIANAQFVDKHGIKDYEIWDSSILEILRLKNKKPAKYRDDIEAGLSYSDLVKKIT